MELIPHESSYSAAIKAIAADVGDGGNELSLNYAVAGDISALVVPAPAEPGRTDELWRTTCFELFVRGEGLTYCEFNFSPSGQWAAYRFDSYRSDVRELALPQPPHIAVDSTAERLTMSVAMILQLPAEARIGLSAVIEAADGRKAYWALAHPPGPADFHHDACFAAAPPAMAARS